MAAGSLNCISTPGIILIHQGGPSSDGTNVPAVVVPVICHQFPSNIRKLLADTLSADAVGVAQHFRNRLHQIGTRLPHLRVTGIAANPGIAYVKDVVQPEIRWIRPAERCPWRPAHIAVHPVVQMSKSAQAVASGRWA